MTTTLDWQEGAACASDAAAGLDFFSADQAMKYQCRALCTSVCPIRKECINHALQQKEIYGVWGGVDEYEIRRALSLNYLGEPIRRKHKPRCPYCIKSRLTTLEKKRTRTQVQCDKCSLTWWIRRAPRTPKFVDPTVQDATIEDFDE